jgi:phospholipid/cholesterol/gamma-HCH transport system substrate-binding protein
MDADARYTYVGAALLALLAALVGALLWLKDVGRADAFVRYAIHFERQSLAGLDVGAPVQLRGIKVGRVEDYSLAGDKGASVRVVVRLDRRTPLQPDTTAVVTRNLVTGIASIALVAGTGVKPQTPADVQDPLPLIAEGQSDLDEIAGRFSQVGDQASVALANLNLLLTGDNRRDVMDTIRSVRDLSLGVQKRLDTLEKSMQRVGAASVSIGEAAQRLGGSAERIAEATADTTRKFGQAGERLTLATDKASARLDQTMNQADAVLSDARATLQRMSAATEHIDQQLGSSLKHVENAALQVEDQAGAAVLELRLSLEAANRVLDRLRDPRAALLGPGAAQLGPGEVKP